MVQPERDPRGDVRRRLRRLAPAAAQAAVGADRTLDGAANALIQGRGVIPQLSQTMEAPDSTLEITTSDAVTVDMFNTDDPSKIATLVRHYVGQDIDVVAALSNNRTRREYEARRKKRFLKYHPEVTASEYTAMRAEKLKEIASERTARINKHVYETFQQEQELDTIESTALVFEAQRQEANRAVAAHGQLIYPDDVRTEQRNEVDLEQKPSDLIDLYFGNGSDELLRSEIQRQTLLTVISSQIEQSKKGGANEKLSQIQSLLNQHLFDVPLGSTITQDIYGVFNNDTNELVTLLDEQPERNAPRGSHYKKFVTPMRRIKGSDKLVLTKIGPKERSSAISKAIHKAKKRFLEGDGGDIRREDIEDTHRLMLVVNGSDTDARQIMENVFSILVDHSTGLANRDVLGNPMKDDKGRLTGLPDDVLEDNDTDVGNGSVSQYRIKMFFSDLASPIEIIVRTMESYLNADHEVGTYNEQTGKYTGIAHPLYKFYREVGITDEYFPEGPYPQLVRPTAEKADGTQEPHKMAEVIVLGLKGKAVYVPNQNKEVA